jgi:hypothetical protein
MEAVTRIETPDEGRLHVAFFNRLQRSSPAILDDLLKHRFLVLEVAR